MRRQGKSLIRITVDSWGPIATGGFPPDRAPAGLTSRGGASGCGGWAASSGRTVDGVLDLAASTTASPEARRLLDASTSPPSRTGMP